MEARWLRSPCDLGCLYCYFGTIEEHHAGPGVQEGQLSHLSRAYLPAPAYPGQVVAAITAPVSGVQSCFGGSTLAFIEPDGSLWDCPCWLRIAVTPPARRAIIRGADARTLFASPPPCADCALCGVPNSAGSFGFRALSADPACQGLYLAACSRAEDLASRLLAVPVTARTTDGQIAAMADVITREGRRWGS